MAHRKSGKTARSGLPTKEDILNFVAENPGRIGKREIARAFHVAPADRVALKGLLRTMAEEGLLEKSGRRLQRPGMLPKVAVLSVTGRDNDGELVARPADWDELEAGPAPKIILRQARRTAEPPPGVGDRVLARLEFDDKDSLYLARPIKILGHKRTRILGIVHRTERGNYQIEPIDKKAKGVFRVLPENLGGATDGDLVSAEPVGGRRQAHPTARVVESLASIKSEKAVSLIALHDHDIPYVFPQRVLDEAEAATLPGPDGRDDLTPIPFVTIDPFDAKDHDDAVFAEADDDKANRDGWIVWVAIADVAALVRPGTALDREALLRGNSVYFPDRVVPMLPEQISNNLCSLKENEIRPAMVARMVFGADGRKRSHTFMRAMIRSVAKLSYQQAQAAIDGHPDETTDPLLENVLEPLWDAYHALDAARQNREPLDLDLPERKLILNPDGTVKGVEVPPRLDAHRLIEEFMIQANVAAAESLEEARVPLLFRAHDTPSLAKLEALREFLQTLDLSVPRTGKLLPAHFNRILASVAETEHAQLVNEVVLRSQAQAEYSAENYGHFGLNLRRYAHFTSPIRRYADLIVHRALITAFKLGKDGLDPTTIPKLTEIAAAISATERRAMAAERDTLDRLIARFLEDRIGATFGARISGVTRAGLFVRLDETGADGIVPMSALDYDYFRVDEDNRALVGERSGDVFQLGDAVEVRLVEAAPVAGALRFEMVSDGKKATLSVSGRPGKGRRPGQARDRQTPRRAKRAKGHR